MIRALISILLAYAIGNIQSGVIISTKLFKRDVRLSGSGSSGATNMLRNFGKRYGVLTLALDLLKGLIAVLLCRLIGGEKLGAVCGALGAITVVAGHNWPVFYGFKGGKGAATSLGAVLAIHPGIALIALIAAVAAAAISTYMSVGSMVGVLVGVILCIAWLPVPYKWMALALLAICIFQHRENIKRLLNGTESKLFERGQNNKNSRNLK